VGKSYRHRKTLREIRRATPGGPGGDRGSSATKRARGECLPAKVNQRGLFGAQRCGDSGAPRTCGRDGHAAHFGLPHQDSEPKDWYLSQSSDSWEPAHPGIALDPSFPQVAAALIGPIGREGMLMEPPAPFWVAQLPHHRDEMMARDYRKNGSSQTAKNARLLRDALR
jgi:hypothetical protein